LINIIFAKTFTGAIRGSIQFFLTEHRDIIDNYEKLSDDAWKIDNVRDQIY